MRVRIDPHAADRLFTRGASLEEVEAVLAKGTTGAALGGRKAKELVFRFEREWTGHFYPEKKVRVVYVEEDGVMVVVTVLVYYGQWSKP